MEIVRREVETFNRDYDNSFMKIVMIAQMNLQSWKHQDNKYYLPVHHVRLHLTKK